MRILIADQNRTFRAEFVALITHCHPGWQITELDDTADLYARMFSSRFDVAFLDLDLDTTIDLPALREDCPDTKIIGLGEHNDPATMVRCIQDGLGGYIARNSTGTRLFTTLKVIATPDLFVSTGGSMMPRNGPQPPQPQLSLVQPTPPRPLRPTGATSGAAPAETGHPLTARQVDVLKLLAEGRSTKDIARRLGLAVPTVKTHLAAVYRQLGARNRLQAVVNASSIAAAAASRAAPAMKRPAAPSPMYERHFAAG